MEYQDRMLVCAECGQSFAFTADEQAYHAEKGYANEPKRCPSCRQNRRDARVNGNASGGYRREREMFPAVCANCGKDTMVPFQPKGYRPVYCQECFSQQASRA